MAIDMNVKEAHHSYITTYLPICGHHKAVMMCWDDKMEMYTPEITGLRSWPTIEQAQAEAIAWAMDDELEYRS